MKNEQIRIRIEPSLKRSFEVAAKLNGQTLSAFLVQAGITAAGAAFKKAETHPDEPNNGMPSKRHQQDAYAVLTAVVVGGFLVILAILFRGEL